MKEADMDKLPLISVIVPVYKVEAYLDKCISSIVEQTYKNLEIILVDDGSPDNCPAMCDAWAEKDGRIKVIHQKNAGGGAARNAALDIAQGDLIAFADSDDYLAPDMYMHLFELLAQGADIAECGYISVWDDGAVFRCEEANVKKYTAREAMAEHIQDRLFRQLIWNKLYYKKIIGEIRFPAGKKIDDEFFTYQVIGNANCLIHSDQICYAYRQQKDSVMHSMSPQKRLQAVEAKVQRQIYIENRFPDLSACSLKNLWFTCLYQGQLALRDLDAASAEKTIAYLCEVLAVHPCTIRGYSFKEKIWLSLARHNLKVACCLRNMLKIGL